MNSGEDLFRSCELKLLCNLNPKLIFEFDEGAAAVVPAGWTCDEVALAGANVTSAGGEVTVAGGEVALPSGEVMFAGGDVAVAGFNVSKIHKIKQKRVSIHLIY